MGPARFHCATLLLMNNVLKFNYAFECFQRKVSKNGPLILYNVPCCRSEIKRKTAALTQEGIESISCQKLNFF